MNIVSGNQTICISDETIQALLKIVEEAADWWRKIEEALLKISNFLTHETDPEPEAEEKESNTLYFLPCKCFRRQDLLPWYTSGFE